MSLAPHETDFAESLPSGVLRRDMPDGRTRLHVLGDFLPEDIKDQNPITRHRVIDLATGLPVLSLWELDCQAADTWRDGALDLFVRPPGLALRIDLARMAFRADEGPWQPLDELQPYVEQAVGDGFGVRAVWEASIPERERTFHRRWLEDKIVVAFAYPVLGLSLAWLVWMLIFHPDELHSVRLWRFPFTR